MLTRRNWEHQLRFSPDWRRGKVTWVISPLAISWTVSQQVVQSDLKWNSHINRFYDVCSGIYIIHKNVPCLLYSTLQPSLPFSGPYNFLILVGVLPAALVHLLPGYLPWVCWVVHAWWRWVENSDLSIALKNFARRVTIPMAVNDMPLSMLLSYCHCGTVHLPFTVIENWGTNAFVPDILTTVIEVPLHHCLCLLCHCGTLLSHLSFFYCHWGLRYHIFIEVVHHHIVFCKWQLRTW